MKWIYELGYRHFQMPSDNGPDQHLVDSLRNMRVVLMALLTSFELVPVLA